MTDASLPNIQDTSETLVRAHADKDSYMQHLGAEVIKAAPGLVVLRMPVTSRHLNFNGTCHGGAIFGLADSAFGLASNSHGPVAAGIDAHVVYSSAAREGEVLTARAWQITDTPRLASYRVDVTNDCGTVIAAFTGTAYVTRRQHRDPG